jgi:hypothetical protein
LDVDILNAEDVNLGDLVASTNNGNIVHVGDVFNNYPGCPSGCGSNRNSNLTSAVTLGGVSNYVDLSHPAGDLNIQLPSATGGGSITKIFIGGDPGEYGSTGNVAPATSNSRPTTGAPPLLNDRGDDGSGCENCHNSQVIGTTTIGRSLVGGTAVSLPWSNFSGERLASPFIRLSKSGGHLVGRLASRLIRSALGVKAFPNTGTGMSDVTNDQFLIWLAVVSMALAGGGVGLRWSTRRQSL